MLDDGASGGVPHGPPIQCVPAGTPPWAGRYCDWRGGSVTIAIRRSLPRVTVLDIQLSPAHSDWAELRAASLHAEEMGFDALWVFDHLAGASLGGDQMLECFTWLGALAEITETIELGAMVANVWNRQVGTTLAAAASVAAISGRRFHLGVGAGSSPTSRWSSEQKAVGAYVVPTFAERHRRVEELLDLSDELWREDRDPRFDSFARPDPPPTRIVGVNSVELSSLAGRRADGVNVRWDHPRRRELLDAARAAANGRPFVYTAWIPWDAELLDEAHPTRHAVRDDGIDRLVLVVKRPSDL